MTVDQLAAAGIAVYEDPEDKAPIASPAAPVSPVRLLAWQVQALAHNASMGLTAAELDGMFAETFEGELDVSPSEVIIAWANGVDTPAARHAREVLAVATGGPDETGDPQPLFPDLVLILFASDVAVVGESLPNDGVEPEAQVPLPGFGGSMMVLAAGNGGMAGASTVGDACTTGIGFINGSVAATFDALQKLITPPPVNTGFHPFDTLANVVVGAVVGAGTIVIKGAQIFVNDVLIGLTVGHVMNVVATIAGFVGTLAEVTSLVKPWNVNLAASPDPGTVVLAPADQGQEGVVTAAVEVGVDSWPAWMEACASAAGRPLPSLKPQGYPVSWDFSTVPADLAVVGHADGQLSDRASAKLEYRTAVQDVPNPKPRPGLAETIVYIERDDARKLATLVADLINRGTADLFPILTAVPPIAEAVHAETRALANEVLTKVLKELNVIQLHTDRVVHSITWYEPSEEDPATTAPPTVTTPKDPGTRSCPYATVAEAESLSGIDGLVNLMVLMPGDLAQGYEVPSSLTSCTWSTGAGDWQVIVAVHRGTQAERAHADYRAEMVDNESFVVTEVPGPWDTAFATRFEIEGAQMTADVYALRGDVFVESHIINAGGGHAPVKKFDEAAALIRHVYGRLADP